MTQEFFKGINFNKNWDETDWEKFFRAQDTYHLSLQASEIREKPLPRIKFLDSDEVEAFEPVLHEYGISRIPSGLQLPSHKFLADEDPTKDYHPSPNEDPHYWLEGAPLKSLLIYRDCCRFAISTVREIEKYLKRRGPNYKKKNDSRFELLRFHAYWIAINVAEGHRVGYSEDRLYGNIAKCNRALWHADKSIGLVSRISLKTKSVRLREDLFSFAFQLRNALYAWIDELRSKVST